MLKKIVSIILFFSFSPFCFAKTTVVESTPFKFLKSELTMIADARNFAYNCVLTDDDATVYEVLSNSYATSGTLLVSVYCLQYKITVALPLTLNADNKITTPTTTYPIKFDRSMPASCQRYTQITVTKEPNFSQGYTIKLG
jgi:hypothetical protein